MGLTTVLGLLVAVTEAGGAGADDTLPVLAQARDNAGKPVAGQAAAAAVPGVGLEQGLAAVPGLEITVAAVPAAT